MALRLSKSSAHLSKSQNTTALLSSSINPVSEQSLKKYDIPYIKNVLNGLVREMHNS